MSSALKIEQYFSIVGYDYLEKTMTIEISKVNLYVVDYVIMVEVCDI